MEGFKYLLNLPCNAESIQMVQEWLKYHEQEETIQPAHSGALEEGQRNRGGVQLASAVVTKREQYWKYQTIIQIVPLVIQGRSEER